MIRQLRINRFGRDIEITGPSQAIVAQQNGLISRALGRLSRDLYSKDTHFVLELVQNADDNAYPPSSLNPTLHFVLESERFVVLNNEEGFSGIYKSAPVFFLFCLDSIF